MIIDNAFNNFKHLQHLFERLQCQFKIKKFEPNYDVSC